MHACKSLLILVLRILSEQSRVTVRDFFKAYTQGHITNSGALCVLYVLSQVISLKWV